MAYRHSNTPKITDLSDAELLAHYLRNSKTAPSIDKARNMINEAGSLTSIVNRSNDGNDFLKPTEANRLLSGIEIGRRIAFEKTCNTDVLSSPQDVRDFLTLQLANCEHEIFCCIYLDNRHRVMEFAEVFCGTIDSAAVYPREIVKQCLAVNAAAVIFSHNHPSGVAEPSDNDIRLTKKLIDALALVDVRVLDHLVVGRGVQTSLAERGLM